MSSRILGVDLGAYSVKVVVANLGFRGASVSEFFERRVPDGEEPAAVRAARVLGDIIREHNLAGDTPCAAVPGNELFIHVLEFSFPSLKRSELEKVVGAELEDVLPIDLEDMVYAFDTIPKIELENTDDAAGLGGLDDLGAPISDDPEDEPTFVQGGASRSAVVRGRVAAPVTGMRVLACAMPRVRASATLDVLSGEGLEIRSLIPAPASYMRVADAVSAGIDSDAVTAVIDIGHERTDVCIVKGGRAVFARTIPRGGKAVTTCIARTWQLSEQDAENAKHKDGFVASAAEPATSDAWARIHEVVVVELSPLARDLRQTLSACRAKTGAVVSHAVLVGGGARLRGLGSFLGENLGVRCAPLTGDDDVVLMGENLASTGVRADTACLALGVAFEGASGRPHFDLRQGDLAFKADLSFLRSKASTLAASMLVVIAFVAFNAYARLHKLRKAEALLDERLAVETTTLFGRALSAKAALGEAGGGEGDVPGGEDSPMPKMTAYDILLDINSRLPSAKEIKIDVTNIDIKRGRISMKAITGTTEKHDAVEASAEVIKALKGQDCFDDVSRGNISSGPNDTKNFPINIKSSCR